MAKKSDTAEAQSDLSEVKAKHAKKKADKGGDPADEMRKLAATLGGTLMADIDANRGSIDLGALAVNKICSGKYCNGGLPRGTLAEVYGPSGSGKSVIGANFLKGVQKEGGVAVLIDAEHALNPEFAERSSKLKKEGVIVTYPKTLQSAFNCINMAIKTVREKMPQYNGKPIGILYDSIAVSPSADEMAETDVDMETSSKEEKKRAGVKGMQPGERARICSRELRKLMGVVAENDAVVLIINQVRNKIGVLYGDPRTTAGGGESLKFYCHTRFEVSASKKISGRKITDKLIEPIGVIANVKNVKSRNCDPFMVAEGVSLIFKQGVDPFGGLLSLLLLDKRIEGSGGNYKVLEPWAGGKEVKFKASKEVNKVPLEVLLECPALVDAESADEVKYYTELYQGAIDDAESTEYVKEDVTDEESDL